MEFSFKGRRCDLCAMMRCLCGRSAKAGRIMKYQFKGILFTSKGDHMSLTVKDTDVPGTVQVSVQFLDAKGKPTTVDGVPTWSASDPTVLDSITPAADGLSATLHITDTPGASNLTINADVNMDPNTTENKDFVDTVSVVPGDAASVSMTFGAVTPDP